MQLWPLFSFLGSPLRNRSRPFGALTVLAAGLPLMIGAALPTGNVSASVTGLRSSRGAILACLTARPKAFPDCERDPDARTLAVPVAGGLELDFGPVPIGRYAIALIHDENANGRLDKALLIPREGFGFSRDAPVRMGPPSFSEASFPVDVQGDHETIRMRYLF